MQTASFFFIIKVVWIYMMEKAHIFRNHAMQFGLLFLNSYSSFRSSVYKPALRIKNVISSEISNHSSIEFSEILFRYWALLAFISLQSSESIKISMNGIHAIDAQSTELWISENYSCDTIVITTHRSRLCLFYWHCCCCYYYCIELTFMHNETAAK